VELTGLTDKELEQLIYEAKTEQLDKRYRDKLLKERERRNKYV
jgi:hypothetical protein